MSNKFLVPIIIIIASFGLLILSTLSYVGIYGIDTKIQYEYEIPRRYISEIKELGMLNNDDRIKYFYSDGFLDIKSGFYFASIRNIGLYNKDWNENKVIIPFDEIASIYFNHNPDFLEDSYIYIETISFNDYTFPISSEQGRDKLFYKYILEKTEL